MPDSPPNGNRPNAVLRVMSFLGVGVPPEVPSWGNIIADGRTYFQIFPGLVFFPGAFLALTVLAINLIGDAMRDALDPKLVGKR